MLGAFHLLLRGKCRGDLGHGRVPTALRSDVKVAHQAVHRAPDDIAGIHSAGRRFIDPVYVAGDQGPLARKTISSFECSVAVESDRALAVTAATTPAIKESPLTYNAHDFSLLDAFQSRDASMVDYTAQDNVEFSLFLRLREYSCLRLAEWSCKQRWS